MDIEERDYGGYVQRIEQIDRILQEPIQSIVHLVVSGLQEDKGGTPGFFRRSLAVPAGITEDQESLPTTQINNALCCSTLQRIWFHRRRFPLLAGELEKLAQELAVRGSRDIDPNVPELLAEPFLPREPDNASFKDLVKVISNPDAGPCDTYTASQVFWVLLNAGERNAHTATGFFAFFSILWALRRRFPEPGGVSVGNSPPSAYVTAKCLAPLFHLLHICRRRAALFDQITSLLIDLRKLMEHQDETRRSQWLPLRLDELAGKLHEISSIAINREGFRSCAKEIGEIADELHSKSPTGEPWARVIASLVQALQALGIVGNQGLSEAQGVVREFLPALVAALEEVALAEAALKEEDPATHSKKLEKLEKLKSLGLDPKPPHFHAHTGKRLRYWEDLASSAKEALVVCESAFQALDAVSCRCSSLTAIQAAALREEPELRKEVLDLLLGHEKEKTEPGLIPNLAGANRKVADQIEKGMSEAVQWCDVALMREIAHASAQHLTEFDPAELVSALFVTVSGHRIDSSLRVADAVEKALVGMRQDGSWVPGQPFFVRDDFGIWAPTSDIVWMLSSTIAQHPNVRVADEALGAYVNWLERTRKQLTYEGESKGSGPRKVSGWISERNFREKRIDMWATMFAVNALLGIRELMEFRLWELCDKRFTVLSPSKKLSDIDAVDLGASHEHRLHRRLARMARQAAGDEYGNAEYSLVLHGPPGSSKTLIAEALAAAWQSSRSDGRRGARLIRITPADFTRKGEDRLDAEARLIFEILGRVRGITILFDEIDDLLRLRDGRGEASFFKLVVPGMLNRLQDLRNACPKQEICFVLATNYVDRIEPALLRKGRIDRAVPLVYPDRESRRCTLGRHAEKLRDKTSKEEWKGWAASLLEEELGTKRIRETDYWPWKTFDTLCRELIGELEKVWRAGLAPQAREQQARQRIERVLVRCKAMVSSGIYGAERRKRLRICAELREEVLQYSLAGAEDTAELLDRLHAGSGASDPGSWRDPSSLDGKVLIHKESATRMRSMLGEDLQGKLLEIASMRGWASLELGIAEDRP